MSVKQSDEQSDGHSDSYSDDRSDDRGDDRRKTRLLLVVRWPVGGIRTYIKYVYNHPCFQQFEIVLVVTECHELPALIENLDGTDIRIVPVAGSSPMLLRGVMKLLVSESFDLIHAHGVTSAVFASLPAKVFGVPLIVTLHEAFYPAQFAGFRGGIKQRILAQLFKLARHIQPVSQAARQNFVDYFPSVVASDNTEVSALLNGIDPDKFDDAVQRDIKAELGLASNTIVAGYLGRFMPPKGFTLIIQALEKIVHSKSLQAPLLVYAVGSGDYIREYQALIAEAKIEANFHFVPFTDRVGDLLQSVDFVLIPSLREACPLLPMEALVCGTPTIGTSCIGLEEVLMDTPATVIEPGNVEQLVDAILEFAQDNRQSDFEAYIATARQRYDVSRTAESLFDVYRSLL